jgi:hypothetical protein
MGQRKFRQLKWKMGSSRSHDTCPLCASKAKIASAPRADFMTVMDDFAGALDEAYLNDPGFLTFKTFEKLFLRQPDLAEQAALVALEWRDAGRKPPPRGEAMRTTATEALKRLRADKDFDPDLLKKIELDFADAEQRIDDYDHDRTVILEEMNAAKEEQMGTLLGDRIVEASVKKLHEGGVKGRTPAEEAELRHLMERQQRDEKRGVKEVGARRKAPLPAKPPAPKPTAIKPLITNVPKTPEPPVAETVPTPAPKRREPIVDLGRSISIGRTARRMVATAKSKHGHDLDLETVKIWLREGDRLERAKADIGVILAEITGGPVAKSTGRLRTTRGAKGAETLAALAERTDPQTKQARAILAALSRTFNLKGLPLSEKDKVDLRFRPTEESIDQYAERIARFRAAFDLAPEPATTPTPAPSNEADAALRERLMGMDVGSVQFEGRLSFRNDGGSRYWFVNYQSPGANSRRRAIGLGSVARISLGEARRRAAMVDSLLAQGMDPLDHKAQVLGTADTADIPQPSTPAPAAPSIPEPAVTEPTPLSSVAAPRACPPETDKRIRLRLLDDYDVENERYPGDLSDAKIAASMDIPPAWVRAVRERLELGPDVNEVVAGAGEAVAIMKTLKAELAEGLSELDRKVSEIEQRQRDGITAASERAKAEHDEIARQRLELMSRVETRMQEIEQRYKLPKVA